MSEMTVREQMIEAKKEKDRLIRMILTYQKGKQYTPEDLAGKKLKSLQAIYDKVVHN